MLHFEGDREFPQPAAALSDKLSDVRFLVDCIPDVESVQHCDRSSAALKLRPGLSFARSTLDLTMKLTEEQPGSLLRLAMQTRGIGSSSTVEAAMQFLPREQGTVLHWSADVKELGGLLKAVPQGLIRAAAQKVIADAWNALEKRLTAPAEK